MGAGIIIALVCVGGFVGLLFIVGMMMMSIYNGLVTLRNRYENAFAQIDVQLKRRYDLIPNLVEVAKGYMKHEKETLEAVIAMRNTAYAATEKAAANPSDPNAIEDLAKADGALNSALGRLLMVAESYPDLKANENMLSLQEELTSTENKVSFARQSYNDSVTAYNTKREVFPAVVFAGMFGFNKAELLQVEDPKEREAVQVKF